MAVMVATFTVSIVRSISTVPEKSGNQENGKQKVKEHSNQLLMLSEMLLVLS